MSVTGTQAVIRECVGLLDAVNTGMVQDGPPNPFRMSDRIPRSEPNRTASVIYDMMTENTGSHMLDSGGAYGRAFQKNRTNGFERGPEAWLSFDGDGKVDGAGVSLFACLCEFLTFDARLQRKFDKFNRRYDPENRKAWLEIMEAFGDENCGRGGVYNTYNDEFGLLSGIIQYVTVQTDDCDSILLQHHGGCDVRGGYSAPRAFDVSDMEAFLMSQNDMSASCECTGADICSGCVETSDISSGVWESRGDEGWPDSWKPAGGGAAKCTKCGKAVTCWMSRP